MELGDLRPLMDNATRGVFRLETLPQYLVPQEAERFAAFRAGHHVPPRAPESSEWLAKLQQIIASGIRWYRVHVLDFPLCDYSLFELYAYQDSQKVGQEIFLADRAEHLVLEDMHEDFWLMDDDVAVRMVYDKEGHFLRPERIDDATPYVTLRETAMRCAEPMDEFIARRNPKLTI